MGAVIPYPRENVKGRIYTCPDMNCRYVSLVPPDYPGEPVCPRCLWDQVQASTPPRRWLRMVYRAVGVLLLCAAAFGVGVAIGLACARFCP